MIIEKITREYSKSINLGDYGAPREAWVKSSAVYQAVVESSDDPKLVGEHLSKLAQEDVISTTKAVVDKIKSASTGVAAGAASNSSQPRSL